MFSDFFSYSVKIIFKGKKISGRLKIIVCVKHFKAKQYVSRIEISIPVIIYLFWRMITYFISIANNSEQKDLVHEFSATDHCMGILFPIFSLFNPPFLGPNF